VKEGVERMSAGILNDAESDLLEYEKKGFRPRSMNRLRWMTARVVEWWAGPRLMSAVDQARRSEDPIEASGTVKMV
jgi:hypothetical protein